MSEELYRHKILDHYRSPRNFGVLKNATHSAGHANISCGDQVQFQAIIKGGKIVDLAFSGEGCAVSTAAASMIGEYALGKSFAGIKKLDKKSIEKLLGIKVTGAREKCAMLGLDTLQQLQKTSRKSAKKD